MSRRKSQPKTATPAALKKMESAATLAFEKAHKAVKRFNDARGIVPVDYAAQEAKQAQATENLARRAFVRKNASTPANHFVNEGEPIGTVHNVHAVLDYMAYNQLQDEATSEEAEFGRYLLLSMLSDALRYVEDVAKAEDKYEQAKAKKGGAR